MTIPLPIQAGEDDSEFVTLIGQLLERSVSSVRPMQVFVSRVDNWFGDRWFGFRGKLLGAAGVRKRVDDSRLTLPPFVPERIVSEHRYERKDNEQYEPTADFAPLSVHQSSAANAQRRVDRFTKNGILLWYSGNTATQEFGSSMLYVHAPVQRDGWYLCLRKEAGAWCFHKGIGITKQEIQKARAVNGE